VKNILKSRNTDNKVRLVPDVAFVLDSREPQNICVGKLLTVRTKESIVVGLNVSALLFHGGYTRDNMFGLKTDYFHLVCAILELLMEDKRTLVLIVPHVFPPPGYEIESDADVCSKIYDMMSPKYPGRVFLTQGKYDQAEIKYIIGLCDLFIGSRMHACIAAISQHIPTVGVAYSKKFIGVFQTIGGERYVLDARCQTQSEILGIVKKAIEERKVMTSQLDRLVPDVQRKVLQIFDSVPA
jgi:polysaccharide pyruvyl transferase WcaK-like protein